MQVICELFCSIDGHQVLRMRKGRKGACVYMYYNILVGRENRQECQRWVLTLEPLFNECVYSVRL